MSIADRFIEDKVELLREHDNSRAIYQLLQDTVELYYWECNDDSLVVDDEPFGAGYKIELLTSLLSDLSSYHRYNRCDDTIPDYLAYITPFFTDECDEDDDDDYELDEAA